MFNKSNSNFGTSPFSAFSKFFNHSSEIEEEENLQEREVLENSPIHSNAVLDKQFFLDKQLWQCAIDRDVVSFRAWIREGANPFTIDEEHGWTLLHFAVQMRASEIILELNKRLTHEQLSVKDSFELTPLDWMRHTGQLDLLKKITGVLPFGFLERSDKLQS